MNEVKLLHQELSHSLYGNPYNFSKTYRYVVYRLQCLGYSLYIFSKNHGTWLEFYAKDDSCFELLRIHPEDPLNDNHITGKYVFYVKNRKTDKAEFFIDNSDYDIMFTGLVKKIWELGI